MHVRARCSPPCSQGAGDSVAVRLPWPASPKREGPLAVSTPSRTRNFSRSASGSEATACVRPRWPTGTVNFNAQQSQSRLAVVLGFAEVLSEYGTGYAAAYIRIYCTTCRFPRLKT